MSVAWQHMQESRGLAVALEEGPLLSRPFLPPELKRFARSQQIKLPCHGACDGSWPDRGRLHAGAAVVSWRDAPHWRQERRTERVRQTPAGTGLPAVAEDLQGSSRFASALRTLEDSYCNASGRKQVL